MFINIHIFPMYTHNLYLILTSNVFFSVSKCKV